MSGAFQNNMRNLFILLWDEFKGYTKSKAIFVVWIGMPAIVVLMHFLTPAQSDLPVTMFTGLLIAIVGGVLASVILGTTMTNEITKSVYTLFLIRPVKRWQIIVSKYIAMIITLIIASFLSFAIGILIDSIKFSDEISTIPDFLLKNIINTSIADLFIAISAMSVACVIGLFIGMIARSVAVSAILSFYLGQQISTLALLPRLLEQTGALAANINPLYLALGVGFAATVVFLALGIFIFYKKQF